MQLALIRHLPTDWNKNGYLQGKRDIPVSFPLNQATKATIKKNCDQLIKWEPFDAVFASSLQRTKQTAKVYGFDSLIIEEMLDELHFGCYEGKPKEKLLQDFGKRWINEPLSIVLGESLVSFQQRVFLFLRKYRNLDKVLVFGHGSWIRAIMSIEKTGNINSMNQMVVNNNELVVVTIREKWINA